MDAALAVDALIRRTLTVGAACLAYAVDAAERPALRIAAGLGASPWIAGLTVRLAVHSLLSTTTAWSGEGSREHRQGNDANPVAYSRGTHQ